MKISHKKYTIAAVFTVLILIAFWIGFAFGRHNPTPQSQVSDILNMSSASTTDVDFSTFWQVWNILNTKYVPTHSTTTPTDQAKVYGAIQGLAASYGDPYTVFFPPTDNQSFQDQISGSFGGVGMEVDTDANGILTVTKPLPGTPAANAGIKTGDQILSINGQSTTGMSDDDAVNLIKGPKGTTVTLSILRAGIKAPFTVSMVRDTIAVPTIDEKKIGDVFVISLYSFDATSPDLFRGALRDFVQSGDSKLVLDLRGNPGGYLEAAVDMASWFLPSGDLVVSEKAKTAADSEDYRSSGYNIFNNNLKMDIVMDQDTASAAEILSGALNQHDVAKLVGTRSYGKGSVQELVPITADTSLKVTIAKWYTPNGTSISAGGLTPDIPVNLDLTKFANGDDTQMDVAVADLDGNTAVVQALEATSTAATVGTTQ